MRAGLHSCTGARPYPCGRGGCSPWPATGRLVEQVRRGNEAAFEVVFERHGPAILAFCRHMLGSPRGGRGRRAAHLHRRVPGPRAGRRPGDRPQAMAVHDRAEPLRVGAAGAARDAGGRRCAGVARAVRGRARRAGRGACRAAATAGRRARAARRAARRAAAHGAGGSLAGRGGRRARLRGVAREGARVPRALGADRPARGARDAVREHPRAARQPARRVAAAKRAAAPPARMSRLPRLPRAGEAAAPDARRGAAGGAHAGTQVERARSDRDRGRIGRGPDRGCRRLGGATVAKLAVGRSAGGRRCGGGDRGRGIGAAGRRARRPRRRQADRAEPPAAASARASEA